MSAQCKMYNTQFGVGGCYLLSPSQKHMDPVLMSSKGNPPPKSRMGLAVS